MLRVAVLASGRGSNLQALIDACAAGVLPVELVGVYSDRPRAAALQRAREAGLHAESLSPRDYPDRLAFDRALFERVAAVQPGLIVCAGYLRILSTQVVEPWIGRMLNIHPSLLPAYQGLNTHERVLRAGDRSHGASVHFVTPELDGGPVIAHVRMAVEDDDTPERLAARLLPLEHRLLVASVALYARRKIEATALGVALDGLRLAAPLELDRDGQLETDADVPA
jgi:phosphoribosylglycinamide formyltransferase-1